MRSPDTFFLALTRWEHEIREQVGRGRLYFCTLYLCDVIRYGGDVSLVIPFSDPPETDDLTLSEIHSLRRVGCSRSETIGRSPRSFGDLEVFEDDGDLDQLIR
jgi:hypothetical protein